MGFVLFFPSSYVPLWGSKTPHRPAGDRVSWCLETSPPSRLPPWEGFPSLTLLSLFIVYILPYLLSKRMGCLSGWLVSSASVQKLFCGICSAFKWSFDEFVGEKVVSLSHSSAILGPPPPRNNITLEDRISTWIWGEHRYLFQSHDLWGI